MENYEPLEVIGSGSFGLIRKIRRRSDGRVLVRKEVDYRRMSTTEKKQLVSEVNILRELRHPHIVRYYERIVDKENCMIYIVMEYCEGGDLADVIKRCRTEGRIMSEEVVWDVFVQLLQALGECHHGVVAKKGVVLHRDIKPENVLLDENHDVKLGDFGLSRVIDSRERDFARTYVGTPYYMSPEIVNETSYDNKSDVWALGCLVYEMCALKPPFEAQSQRELNQKIVQGNIARLPSHYSDELDRIVKLMLDVDPNRRPTIRDLLAYDKVQQFCFARQNKVYARELKRKDQVLVEMEVKLKQREVDLDLRERKMYDSIKQREVQLDDREGRLRKREMAVQIKEAEMDIQYGSDGVSALSSDDEVVPMNLGTRPTNTPVRPTSAPKTPGSSRYRYSIASSPAYMAISPAIQQPSLNSTLRSDIMKTSPLGTSRRSWMPVDSATTSASTSVKPDHMPRSPGLHLSNRMNSLKF